MKGFKFTLTGKDQKSPWLLFGQSDVTNGELNTTLNFVFGQNSKSKIMDRTKIFGIFSGKRWLIKIVNHTLLKKLISFLIIKRQQQKCFFSKLQNSVNNK